MKLTKEVAQAQWNILNDEYLLELDADLVLEERSKTVKAIKGAVMAGIMAGYLEIDDDADKGVLIRQFLKRKPAGFSVESLEYRAPNSNDIARAGIGTETNMANSTRYLRVAASLTGMAELDMYKLTGGDRSRMETIANLFLLA